MCVWVRAFFIVSNFFFAVLSVYVTFKIKPTSRLTYVLYWQFLLTTQVDCIGFSFSGKVCRLRYKVVAVNRRNGLYIVLNTRVSVDLWIWYLDPGCGNVINYLEIYEVSVSLKIHLYAENICQVLCLNYSKKCSVYFKNIPLLYEALVRLGASQCLHVRTFHWRCRL